MITDFTALYYQDPYQSEFSAKVVDTKKLGEFFAIVLDQTCFYPEGGGQPGDTGIIRVKAGNTIQEIQVVDTKLLDDDVLHLCAEEAEIAAGAEVSARIDWERRYKLMQLHSSEHIFSGLVNAHYGFNNVGFHINDNEMYFDFDGYLDEQQLLALETEANRVIYAQLPIQVNTYAPEEAEELNFRSKKAIPEALRLVSIAEVDDCACCGMQVRNTGEIGLFIITNSMRYKSGVRITALAGALALEYTQKLIASSRKIAALLSAPPAEIAVAAEQLKRKLQESESRQAKFSRLYIDSLSQNLSLDGRDSYRYFEGFTSNQLKLYCKSMAETHPGVHYALLAGADPKRLQYFAASKNKDLRHYAEVLNASMNGKGGGRDGFIQGTIAVNFSTARAHFDEICVGLESLLV